MPKFRIRVERIDNVPDTTAQWRMGGTNAEAPDRYAYEMPPAGSTKEVSAEVFDQLVDDLDLPGLVRAINTPGAFDRT